jgi:hypothetical protein
MNKVHRINVGELIDYLKKESKDLEVWLASDDEGNDYGPLVWVERNDKGKKVQEYNLSIDKKRLTLYPVSGYSDEILDDETFEEET